MPANAQVLGGGMDLNATVLGMGAELLGRGSRIPAPSRHVAKRPRIHDGALYGHTTRKHPISSKFMLVPPSSHPIFGVVPKESSAQGSKVSVSTTGMAQAWAWSGGLCQAGDEGLRSHQTDQLLHPSYPKPITQRDRRPTLQC